MTPSYDLNQFSPMPLVEEGDDHDQAHLHPFTTLPNDHNTPPLPCPIFFNTPQLQIANNTDLHLIQHPTLHRQHQQQEFIDHFLIQESSNFSASNTNDIAQRSLCDQQYTRNEEDQRGSGKWMSSKMRIMRKMMNPDGIVSKKPRRSKQLVRDQQNQQASQANSNSDGVVRVCSDCNTTKTPLWRSGPCGPKSLCNACGIRQRKARRALAAAAAVSSGLIPAAALNKVRKEKESDVDRTVPFKKRCRFSAAAVEGINQKKKKKKKKKKKQQQQLCFDDIVISLSKSSAFHRVFPQDEKDAAILLMALSCGLMCS